MPEIPDQEVPPLATEEGAAKELYDAAYFAHHCGEPYERSPIWLQFFAGIADRIVRDIGPVSSLDVGCAMGFLVESLADRGVDAYGIDISQFAISQVRPDMANRCAVGSALEPFARRYDLITCTEVVEHLPPADAEQLVTNICAHTEDVIFTSTAVDYKEETHVNVHPPEHWAELFARNNFQRDVTYDASYLAPWAMRFRRARDPLPRLVREYERELWHARNEAQQRNEVIVSQMEQLNALRAMNSSDEVSRLSHELAAQQRDSRDEMSRLSHELASQQRLLLETYEMLRKQEEDHRNWRESGAGRLAFLIQRGTTRLAPPRTIRQRGLRRLVRYGVAVATDGRARLHRLGRRGRGEDTTDHGEDLQAQYDRWRELHEPQWTDLSRMRRDNRLWRRRPLVSIIMPTYNPQPEWIHPAIDSVLGQVYENWELCIADDASTDGRVKDILRQYSDADSRIKYVIRSANGGICAASASALELATGEFVALLDHDDQLRPHALHRVIEHLHAEPTTDVVYSDEDLLFSNGLRGGPHFKPDWSPDLLLSVNYLCHLMVASRALVDQIGGFRAGFDGAQDHDLALRLTEKAQRVGHVPDVLYSWRQVPGSVASSPTAKLYAYEAGQRAVEAALKRRHVKGTVTLGEQLGTYHARLGIKGQPKVAIIIPTRDRVQLLRECINSVEQLSTYPNWSITIIDNGSVEPETLEYLSATPHAVVHKPGYFNYSELMNFGRQQIDAPYLLMLNNDIITTTPDWIEALLEHAQRAGVGAVGGRLIYPNGRTQHEGIGIGNICNASTAVNLDAGWMGRVVRNVGAVTGACQMVRTEVFDRVGGYDETLQVAYNDVDFCMRVREAGFVILYTPHAELRHWEGATRGKLHPLADQELFWERWGASGGLRDPYISPHLSCLNPLRLRLGPLPTDR